MAKDDYYVIAYKLLSYLYACLKNSDPIDIESLRFVIKVDIKDDYWDYVVKNLVDDDYLTGVDLIPVLGKREPRVRINPNIKITPKGIDFLNNNSAINKAKEFLKEIKEFLPWV